MLHWGADLGRGEGGCCFAVSVNIGGDEGTDAGFVSSLNTAEEAILRKCLAEVHEATSAPSSVCRLGDFHDVDWDVSLSSFHLVARVPQAGIGL